MWNEKVLGLRPGFRAVPAVVVRAFEEHRAANAVGLCACGDRPERECNGVCEMLAPKPFWDPWFGDSVDLHRESDEYCECGAHTKATPCLFPVDKPLSDEVTQCEHPDHPWYCGCPGLRREVTELRGVDCQCAICLGGSN